MVRARRRQLASWIALACGAAALEGCLSPTLPLPPPDGPDQLSESNTQGLWDVRGSCTPGAVVLIRNLETGVLAGEEDDDLTGRYFIQIAGSPCDAVEVFQMIDHDVSEATAFNLVPITGGVPDFSSCP